MILSIAGQARLFLTTVLIGFGIGAVYDLFRVFRIIVPHKSFVVQLEDLFYWIFVTGLMFHIMMDKSYGEIRAFSIIGALLGMTIYFLTFSRLFIKFLTAVVRFILKVIGTMLRIILFPLRLICKLIRTPVLFCKKKLEFALKSTKKVLRKSKNYARIKKASVVRDIKIIVGKK